MTNLKNQEKEMIRKKMEKFKIMKTITKIYQKTPKMNYKILQKNKN